MCNNLHEEKAKPIKRVGEGYKIFFQSTPLSLEPKTSCFGDLYESTPDGWIEWNKKFDSRFYLNSKCGFCFFLSKKEAIKARHGWITSSVLDKTHHPIHKIAYDEGLGKHMDDGFTGSPYMIALCKKFKVIQHNVA